MATLKEIQMRLKSVKNIGKITKSMKMIASTKLTRAQKAMEVARVYGQASNGICGLDWIMLCCVDCIFVFIPWDSMGFHEILL